MLVALLSLPVHAELQLPSVLASHMVVQQGVPVPVWGQAEPGQNVTVRFAGQSRSARADTNGLWRVTLKPVKAPKEQSGQDMVVEAGGQSLRLTDILIGEVWLCSGQSNMEQPVLAAANGREEVRKAVYPQIRLFRVGRVGAAHPQCTVPGAWQVCCPESADDFTAVGYFFGRKIHTELGLPVGLIDAAWGGSIAETWIPRETLAATPKFDGLIQNLDKQAAAYTPQEAEKRQARYPQELAAQQRKADEFWSILATNDLGATEHWEAPAFNDGGWATLDEPGVWENAGVPAMASFDGLVWFRREVEIPADWAGKDLILGLTPLDDSDTTWFNGVQVGRTTMNWTEPRRYEVPGALVKAGKAVIAVQVFDSAFAGGFAGSARQMRLMRKDAPDGPLLALAGPWRYRVSDGVRQWPAAPGGPRVPTAPGAVMNAPAALYNGMLAPLIPFALRGAIWYQGESNRPNAADYPELLTLLIQTWRQRWGLGEFPFGIVQLPNFGNPTPDQPFPKSDWAAIQEAQLKVARTVPGTGLAVTLDIGEARNIHPWNKQEVGARLARWALAQVYGRGGEYCGPLFKSASVKGHEVALAFDHVGSGLATRNGQPPAGFAVAGKDGKYVWATARIDGNTVRVSAAGVVEPAAVAYAWGDDPEQANLMNREGLPASPFRTQVGERGAGR